MIQLRFLAMLLPLAAPTDPNPPQTPTRMEQVPTFSTAEAPEGVENITVKWVKVAAPHRGFILAAVARPTGAGPFPTVILLHGSHGFARQYVQLAQDLARAGLLAVAACWFSGGGGAGSRFITPISCPDAPPMPKADSPEALQVVHLLVQAVRNLPDARPDRIALFGHSRGGGAALYYILETGHVQAAVLDSAGYPDELLQRASQFKAPVLILHGTADRPADGGSALTDIQKARNFEAALRRVEKSVEAKYYEGGEHNGIFTSSTQHSDEVRQIVEFLHRQFDDDHPHRR